jgi:DNA-directed RNA polymerase II subunit RPB1
MDKITQINKIDVNKYPKVYDLTVPSTLNFGLANGLHVVDTGETGYMQRKLIKTMEDGKINYDQTVRLANGGILQFIYGDSGTDTTKQYEHSIKLVEMGDTEIGTKYCFSEDQLKKYKGYGKKENQEYKEMLIGFRDSMRSTQMRTKMSFITLNATYMLPVNIYRIIENVKQLEFKQDGELTPEFIIEGIEKILENKNTRLLCLTTKERADKGCLKYRDDQVAKTILKIAMYEYISPKRCIVDFKLNKAQFEHVMKDIIQNFNKNMIEPGEMVGIIAAQAMGEPLTQLTLNAFHHAGISSLNTTTSGIPRIKELLSLSKKIKTPQMIMLLTKEYMDSRDMANKIASHSKYITIAQLRKRIDVYYEPNPYIKGGFREKDNVYEVFYGHNPGKNSCQVDIASLPWLMRIVLDREKLLEKEVTLLDMKSKFCNAWEKRYTDMKSVKKEERAIFEKVTQCAILSNTDNDNVPIIHIRFDMTDIDLTTINEFIDIVVDKFKLKGLPSITDAIVAEERVLAFDGPDHTVDKKNQFVIYTTGINMYDIRYIVGVDVYRTICNDVLQTYEIFGIEAARATLIREIIFVYVGNAANFQHLSVLADIMTNCGYLISIDRHGMNKSDTDPLSRASFEKTVDQMLTAAVFGEVDKMKGISSRIMAGMVIKGGTGLCDLLLDTDMIEKSEFTEDIGQKYMKTYNEITTSNLVGDMVSKETNTDIFIPNY